MIKGLFYNDHLENYYFAHILDEVYKKQIFFPYLMGKKDLTIIDCGANVGLTVNYFSDYAKVVYAVEPSSDNFKLLDQLIKYNKLKNVIPIQKAISNKASKQKFYHNTNQTMLSLSELVNDNSKEAEEVDVITLTDLFTNMNIQHVDLLKLDIEGEEAVTLCGEEFAKVADKIDVLIYEWHSWCNRNPLQINNCLKDLGFMVYQLPCEATVFAAERIK